MGDVELEAPELDVDEEADRFRRLVAVLVVLVTLFGAIVAYAQAVESNDEDIAAREAQRRAIEGLGEQVDSSSQLVSDLQIASSIDAVLQRQVLNAGRVAGFADDEISQDDAHLAAQERLAAVASEVTDLTPIDPADPTTLNADLATSNERPDRLRLQQTIEADLANQHGGKADTYVAILTVLAVALFLLGLSLTVEGRYRFVLLVPGLAIAAVCTGWSVLTWSKHIEEVSLVAIDDVAEGQALASVGDFDGAIAQFDAAIEESPDFAAAYARRAEARFIQGSDQSPDSTFISTTSDEALEAAIADLDEALARGGTSDLNTVADAGFFHFLDGDFERSIELTTSALEQNDGLAPVWFNLGAAHLALDERSEAQDAYEQAIEVLFDNEPNQFRRSVVLAGARTDLSVLRTILDDDELDDVLGIIVSTEELLADTQLEDTTCSDGEPCEAGAVGADLGEVSFSRNGAFVFADVAIDGAAEGDAVGVAWYYRTQGDAPYVQAAFGFQAAEVVGGRVFSSTLAQFDPACPVVGDYLIRVYAGGEVIGEAAASVGDTIDPLAPDEDGPERGEPAFGVGTPLGSEFTALNDPLEGVQACLPAGFEVSDLVLSAADSFLSFSSDDQAFAIGVNRVSEGASGIDPATFDAFEEQSVTDLVDGEAFPLTVAMITVDGASLTVEGAAAVGRNANGSLAGSFNVVGPDDSIRVILVTTFDGFDGDVEAILREAVATVTFTGVDTGAP